MHLMDLIMLILQEATFLILIFNQKKLQLPVITAIKCNLNNYLISKLEFQA
jgi:hypothetical protein